MLIRLGFAVPFALCLLGCGGAPAAPTPPKAAGPDPHGIEAEEYLVASATVPDGWTSTVDSFVAKMEKAPADKGAEGTFYLVRNGGSEMKTKFFWKSHAATKEELKAGVTAACFTDLHDKSDIYKAPADPAAGRNGHWSASHVADTAELDKGIVKVGNRRCELLAVRVLTDPA